MLRFIRSIAQVATALADWVTSSAVADGAANVPSKVCVDSSGEVNANYYALADAGGSFIMAATPNSGKARKVANLAQSKGAALDHKLIFENERKAS